MYTHIFIHVHIYIYIHIHIFAYSHIHMCAHISGRNAVSEVLEQTPLTCVYIYIYTKKYIYAHMFINTYIYIYIYIYIHIYTEVCTYIYIYTHMRCAHIYIYIHIHFTDMCTPQVEISYGVALVSRIDKIIGLFCKRALQKSQYSAKETYNFIDPTNRSHPISQVLEQSP